MVGLTSRSGSMACSAQDLVTLAATNRSLRDQVVSLLLEIEALREQMEAEKAGVRLFSRRREIAGGRSD